MRLPRFARAIAGLVGLATFAATGFTVAGASSISTPAPAAVSAPATLGVAGDPTAEGIFWLFDNNVRASIGVAPLRYDPSLQVYAQRQAQAMAAAGQLSHSNVASLLGPWSAVAENIGFGPSAEAINQALVVSPGHYQNLSNPAYSAIGVGVAFDAAGQMWTAHVFAN
jgi:uncharacterized protein YkwD